MHRRTFVQGLLGAVFVESSIASIQRRDMDHIQTPLTAWTQSGKVHAAALYVRQRDETFTKTFGACTSINDMFLIASISKPMSVAALMTLYDGGAIRLDDPVVKHLPEFHSDGREEVTVQHLLTHASGLPDQLPENQALRERHGKLSEFVQATFRTPLLFPPGSKYRYSSMGILLAAEIAQRVSGKPFDEFMQTTVFEPLGMQHAVLGLGDFKLQEMILCQVDDAAPESGAGKASAKDWDWNSPYWRSLGSPWGGVHASAADVGRFLEGFLHPRKHIVRHKTRDLMIRNHHPTDWTPRGLGFALGPAATSTACSARTFGHGGATGTMAWADPATDTVCVVLTTLPSTAASPHPRQIVSDRVAAAAKS